MMLEQWLEARDVQGASAAPGAKRFASNRHR
jgi:hypothetical protein